MSAAAGQVPEARWLRDQPKLTLPLLGCQTIHSISSTRAWYCSTSVNHRLITEMIRLARAGGWLAVQEIDAMSCSALSAPANQSPSRATTVSRCHSLSYPLAQALRQLTSPPQTAR
jgi:hypothetical protein